MRTRVLAATLALILSLGLLNGCEGDNYSEWQRVVCDVQLVNEGSPVLSAWVEDGGDGIIGPPSTDDGRPVDVIPVIFRARPYTYSTMVIPEDDVYSSFIITGYNLYWEPVRNVPTGFDMTQFNISNGALYLQVPVGEDAVSAVMIADLTMKDAALAAITANGGDWLNDSTNDFTANARLQFIGHETGSKHQVYVNAGVFVTFTFAVSID